MFNFHNYLKQYAHENIDDIFKKLNTTAQGLASNQVKVQRHKYGKNDFYRTSFMYWIKRLYSAFFNPFTIILYMIGIISIITDMIYPIPSHKNFIIDIILLMTIISIIIRFIHEQRSHRVIGKIDDFLQEYVQVKRNNKWQKIPLKNLVVGDYVKLSTNTKVPADVRLVNVNNLFVSQAILTGESEIFRKSAENILMNEYAITDYPNIAFMGTTVISGNGEGIVISVGVNTLYGSFAQNKSIKINNNFAKSANYIAWTMIKFMLVLLPIVFFIAGVGQNNWWYSFIFALSVAIGLTPELLPIIITACLVKGSLFLIRRKTVVKDLNIMQDLGSMDILCVDKTGTLTTDKITLEYYMDILGNENNKVLDYAYLNSHYLSGVTNQIDSAILECENIPHRKYYYKNLSKHNIKLGEIPFDFMRKCASVLIRNETQQILITKGNIEAIVSRCRYIEHQGNVYVMDKHSRQSVDAVVDEMLEDGMKVVAIAYKIIDKKQDLNTTDEDDLILLGYLAFFNAPKKSAVDIVQKLKDLNIDIKLLTGDNAQVAKSICRRVGINHYKILTGNIIDDLSMVELADYVEQYDIFAELTPKQKADIVVLLKQKGHTVGFLGDGLNDIPAIVEADIGISVETATKVTKDIADVVLLKKDLSILQNAVIEGRKTLINMKKYVKITASSNFGNIVSIICASVFLPFLPMSAIQLLLLNILYDILCLILPWDNIDEEEYHKYQSWSDKSLGKFMCFFGPISSIFDIITFLFLYFIFCPAFTGGLLYSQLVDEQMKILYIAMFQTGWFLESMWSQILILQMLRTKKISFINSNASPIVLIITLFGISLFTILTITPLATLLGFSSLSGSYFIFLFIIVIMYMLTISIVKRVYIRQYHELT